MSNSDANVHAPNPSPTSSIAKTIALTGGTGLVGTALTHRLLELGHRVVHLSRSPSRGSHVRHASRELRVVHWRPLDGVENLQELEGLDGVIHLAGKSIAESRWTSRVKEELRSSRVQATQVLCRQLVTLAKPPKFFISASAIGIYGKNSSPRLTEEAPAATDFLGSLAHDWEQASIGLEGIGTRRCVARFGVILSLKGGAFQKMLPLFRWGLGGRLGSGKQIWSWIDLEDAASALLQMVFSDWSGTFNLVAPESISNAQFTQQLAQHLHRPALLPAPAWVLRLALGEMADPLLLSSCDAYPQRLIEHGFPFRSPNFKAFLAHNASELQNR